LKLPKLLRRRIRARRRSVTPVGRRVKRDCDCFLGISGSVTTSSTQHLAVLLSAQHDDRHMRRDTVVQIPDGTSFVAGTPKTYFTPTSYR
jgi:hypothetical protein